MIYYLKITTSNKSTYFSGQTPLSGATPYLGHPGNPPHYMGTGV
jgi:hypothetical protein